MQELTKSDIEKLLKKKNMDPKVSWLYIQFKKFFEEEYVIDEIDLNDAIKNLMNFLKNKKIKKVIFFPEPSFPGLNEDVPSGIVETDELEEFLKENVDTVTNSHVADENLNWIFTITHEDDFFISGSKAFISDFVKFFGDAKCTPYKEIEEKWKNK
jgi:hypothetical protein